MWEQVETMLRQAILRAVENVAEFLPGVVGLLVILLVTLVLALLARSLVLRALKGLNFDQRAEHLGMRAVGDWSAFGGPSQFVARAVMWIILLAGVLASFSALDAALPEAFARTIFRYMPDVLAALVIIVVGSIAAQFVARSVLIGAVNLQMPSARLLSTGVKWLLLVLAWAMALEHLGIGHRILPLAFGIFFGGIVLALSLAVGLGSKDLVRTLLDRQERAPAGHDEQLPHV